jgi:hypothetical protein
MWLRIKLCWQNVEYRDVTIDSNLGGKFNVRESMHRKNILIYVQQEAMLHSLFYLETDLHVSGCTTTHHQEHKQLYLQHLVFVTLLLLPATIMEELELVWVCYAVLMGVSNTQNM